MKDNEEEEEEDHVFMICLCAYKQAWSILLRLV